MNPSHRTRHLSLTLAGLAAAAAALPGGQGTATAASHGPHQHAAQAIVQQTQTGLTVADLQEIAKVKRDLFWRLAQQTQTGLTVADLQEIAKVKRDLFWRLAERSPRR
jgi:predicted secreted Zn-dependent protease